MRGVLMIALIIAMLIVGILVIKNMGVDFSDDKYEAEKTKIIERAKETAEEAEEKIDRIKQGMKKGSQFDRLLPKSKLNFL
jgi:hypothetical protein